MGVKYERIVRNVCKSTTPFVFEKWEVPANTIFLESELSVGFINYKTFRPGHVLVSPKRIVPTWAELTVEETKDLVILLQQVCQLMQDFYGVGNCNGEKNVKTHPGVCVTLQQGISAGQTVKHLHFHVIPRIPAKPIARVSKMYSLCETVMDQAIDLPVTRLSTFTKYVSRTCAANNCIEVIPSERFYLYSEFGP